MGRRALAQRCGKPTLALKACTDKHPEYYGALSDDGDGDAAEGQAEASAA